MNRVFALDTERLQTAVVDAVQDPVFVHDRDGCIVSVNRAYAKRAGMEAADIIGKPYWNVFPKREGPLPGCGQAVEQKAEEHKVEEFTLDSGEIFLSRTSSILDEKGEFHYAVHTLVDVTEDHRVSNERRILSEAMRQTAGGMLLLDRGLRITYANPALCKLLKRKGERLVGQPIDVLLPENQRFRTPVIREVADSKGSWSGTTVVHAADGTRIPVHLSAAAIRDRSGVTIAYVDTYLDLRAIKEAQRRTETLRAVIEDLSTELDLDTLGRKAVAAAITLTEGDAGMVPLLDEASGMIYHHWHVGVPPDFPMEKVKRPFGRDEGMTSTVLASSRYQIVEDYPNSEFALPEYIEMGVQSVVCVPILVGGKLKGGFAVASLRRPHAFEQGQIPILEAITRQIGVAIQRRDLAVTLRKLSSAVEQSADAVMITDPDGVIEYVNMAFVEITGFSREEVVGRKPNFIKSSVHEDEFYRRMWEILKRGETFRDVFVNRRKDGRVYFEDKTITPLKDKSGAVLNYVSVGRDITDRRRADMELATSRARFRAIFDRAAIGIVLMDMQGRVVESNPELYGMLGCGEEELHGETFAKFTHPDDVADDSALFSELAAGKREYYQREKRYLRKDGQSIWGRVTVSLVRDTRGAPQFAIKMIEDATERRRAEEKARQRQAELAHVSRLNTLGEMVSGLAHELNQPLCAILSSSQACARMLKSRDGSLAGELPEILAEITAQAKRAGEIIRRLRSFTRKEQERTVEDINVVVRDAISLIEVEARRQGAKIRFDLNQDLPPVECDRINIEQVVLNLAYNGLESMAGNKGDDRALTIQTSKLADQAVAVAVHDMGSGVPAEMVDKVFEPFFTTKVSGMGIGLSISRSIIESHGGRLWAAPGRRRGTTFQFMLPTIESANRYG